MNLRDKLMEDTILVPIQASTREDAIQEMLTHLKSLDVLSATVKLFSNITEQENTFISATGRGIAYPHSTSNEVEEFVCVLGMSLNGIDFNSPDGQLCHLILLILSPKDDPSKSRKFITRFRTMLNNPNIRTCLLEARQTHTVLEIIHQWEEDEANRDDMD